MKAKRTKTQITKTAKAAKLKSKNSANASKASPPNHFTKQEEAVLRKLNTPAKIQGFIDALGYDGEDDYFSVRSTLRTRKAHCMGGALLAACCLERLGYGPARVVGFDAQNDDTHAVAVYQKNGYC